MSLFLTIFGSYLALSVAGTIIALALFRGAKRQFTAMPSRPRQAPSMPRLTGRPSAYN
jgi:hypothetical protein